MNRHPQRNNWRDSRFVVALALMLASAALLVWSPGRTSRAQQGPDRQLLRTRPGSETAGKRTALVIGNGAYTKSPPLKNPPNDASEMAATLKALGFDVTSGVNVNQHDMKILIRAFGQKLRAGGSGLFYYAGHGVQSKGRNYLVPVDADIQSEAEVEDAGVDVSLVLNYMDDAQNGLNIVILDACRNNPFARSFRSASNGLAQVDAPTGTLIAYATAPGRVAMDGDGQNGLYTSELLKAMRVPGLSATEMFMRVRAEVMKQTGSKQVPWEASSLVGAFYFSSSPASSSLPNTPATIDAVAVERETWETIHTSNDAQDYKDYLQAYPNGAYAVAARLKIRQLEAAKNANTQPTNTGGNTPSGPAGGANPNAPPPKGFKSQQGIEMVYIPPGRFMMGSTNVGSRDEGPVHEVTINQSFYIGKYEVTQGQWQAVTGSKAPRFQIRSNKGNPSNFKNCGSNCPVEQVSWNDAQDFINKLNEANDGYKYRLPSEAEWEYAARGGTTEDYYAGNVDDIGWYADNSGRKTHAVGGKQPNAFGLCDMAGNVWEWCQDVYHKDYDGAPTDGIPWVSGGVSGLRVLRGGSWYRPAAFMKSASRGGYAPDYRDVDLGFRVVAVVRTQ